MTTEDPGLIMDAASPLQIKFKHVKFKDTFKYFMCALSALSKQFDLDQDKGDFPHEFNIPENQDYVGLLPAEEYYGTRFMTEKRYTEFKEWYDEEARQIASGEKPLWDFQVELEKYCESDVDVLMKAWLSFRSQMYNLTGLYPGGHLDVSAASFTNAVWKTTLEPYQIGVIPSNKYVRNDMQSTTAREWLNYQDMIYYGGELQYAGKSGEGEKRIPLGSSFYKVDGFHEESNTAFEFAGCFYHGCTRCTKPDARSPHSNKSFRDLRTEFANRTAYLKALGYNVVVMWGCEWEEERRQPEVASFLKEIEDFIPEGSPLDPQDALYGGRCGASSVLFPGRYEVPGDDVWVEGLDVVSLYPWAMKNCDYPIGHPEVIYGPPNKFDHSIGTYFGLVKCVVLPPRDLFFPVLPYRVPGEGNTHKLVFPLCHSCATSRQREPCNHSQSERCLRGTWCSPELYKAVERGYRIIRISCVWDYGEKHYKGLFAPFVDKFYKLKAEASGFPNWCQTQQQKLDFLKEFARVEGIELDFDKMKFDAAVRACVKLLLNSCWGKWGQRLDLETLKLFHSSVTFHKFVNSEEWEDHKVRILNAETAMVRAKTAKSALKPSTKGNRVQAAFTTCHARLRLLEFLEELDTRVLYYDTDSVFFRRKAGESFSLPYGDFLGQLSPVFSGRCIEFVALGPKNYAYRTDDSKPPTVKVRGLTFNRSSSAIVNMKLMRGIADESIRLNREGSTREQEERLSSTSGFVLEEHTVPRFTIKRGEGLNDPFVMSPKIVNKVYKVVFDKRFVDWDSDNLLTYPYGFVPNSC